MEIKRDSYLEQLKIRKDNGMIKIITGIRRCGKSFLLFVLFKKYLLESGVDSDHIIEIALDGIENEELRDPKKCFQFIKDFMKDDRKYYLLLDEVQFMPRFECQTAHCGRCKLHFVFGEFTSPIVPYRNLPQAPDGMTADCCSLV